MAETLVGGDPWGTISLSLFGTQSITTYLSFRAQSNSTMVSLIDIIF
jgi:hypothetical protein